MVSSNFAVGFNPNLSFGKGANTSLRSTKANQKDVQKLLSYLGDEAGEQVMSDTFATTAKGGLQSAVLFEGMPAVSFLRNTKKTTGKLFSPEMIAADKANKQAFQNIFKGEGKLTTRISDYVKQTDSSYQQYNALKNSTKTAAKLAKATDKANKAAAKLAANPNSFWAKRAAAKTAAKQATLEAAGKTAGKTATKAAEKVATKATGKVAGKFGKAMKSSGAGIMLVFSGISEVFTDVIPTFKQVGKEEGMKQVGKSTVKVVGDTVGFLAGQKAGVAIGSAIGSAICPGIGTAVGAVVGFVGGLLGSWAAGKITKAITGKSELEKAAEKQAKQNVANIANDPNTLQDVKTATMYKLQEELAQNGKLSKESQEVYDALVNLDNTNPYTVKPEYSKPYMVA